MSRLKEFLQLSLIAAIGLLVVASMCHAQPWQIPMYKDYEGKKWLNVMAGQPCDIRMIHHDSGELSWKFFVYDTMWAYPYLQRNTPAMIVPVETIKLNDTLFQTIDVLPIPPGQYYITAIVVRDTLVSKESESALRLRVYDYEPSYHIKSRPVILEVK